MNQDRINSYLLALLSRLRDAHISYKLDSVRAEAIMVEVTVPGERWEIEILDNGAIEIERFKSDGRIADHTELDDLFSKFSDCTKTNVRDD